MGQVRSRGGKVKGAYVYKSKMGTRTVMMWADGWGQQFMNMNAIRCKYIGRYIISLSLAVSLLLSSIRFLNMTLVTLGRRP